MSTSLPDVAGAADFGVAARRVLDYLHAELPLALWSITRVEGARQTHLFVDEDNPYGVRSGGVSVWEASFCIRMAAGTPDRPRRPGRAGLRCRGDQPGRGGGHLRRRSAA